MNIILKFYATTKINNNNEKRFPLIKSHNNNIIFYEKIAINI